MNKTSYACFEAYPRLFLRMEEQKKPTTAGPYAPGRAKGKIKWI
jgi:hypothetical protein